MTHAAIEADLATYKIIQGRKAFQIILEVPLEKADSVTTALGWPNFGGNNRVAVVKLNEENKLED